MISRSAAALLGALIISGCQADEPEPGAPVVLRFAASDNRVAPGERVLLEWSASRATTVTIRNQDGALLVGGSDRLAGQVSTGPLFEDVTFALRASGPGGRTGASVHVDVIYPEPEVTLFRASPDQIVEGEVTQLIWQTRNGEGVRIVDDLGALVYAGAALSSELTLAPVRDTVYTLAVDRGGRTATATAAVTVTPSPPIIDAFFAEPARLFEGDPCVLSWRTRYAQTVRVLGEDGAPRVTTSSASSSLIVRPTSTTTYTLIADNPEGSSTATVQVIVDVLGPPSIRGLTAQPEVTALGGTTTLSWQMSSAERYRVLADGFEVLEQASTGVVANEPVTVTSTRTVFTVQIENRVGFAEASVVVFGNRTPLVETFTVTPVVLEAPGTVELAWSVQDVVDLDLLRDGAPLPGFTPVRGQAPQAAQGSLTVNVEDLAHFELRAASAGGLVVQEEIAVIGLEEDELNDRFSLANPLPAPLGRVRASLFAPTDRDVFALDVPPEGRVRAQVRSGRGLCKVDVRLTLTSTDRFTVLAIDDDDGVGACPRIDPALDPAVVDLPPGRYYLTVEAQTSTSSGLYALDYEASVPTCGDGRRENAEQCDDGNLVPGDGCNSNCEAEVSQRVAAPGGAVTVNHPGGGGTRFVAVDGVQPGQRIEATAASASAGTCNVVDTSLELFDPSFAALGRRAGGGPAGAAGECAALAVPPDRFAADLRPGTHYLRIDSENAVAGPVALSVSVLDPACGNLILERRAGEQCDDGNRVSGDGCSAFCATEQVLPEVEPNDIQAFAFATGLTGPGEVTIQGGNDPTGDDDVFSFEVPATSTLTFSARTFSTAGNPTSCDPQQTDTRIYLEADGAPATFPGSGEIAFNDDIDNPNNIWCSQLSQIPLTGGARGTRYFIRVQGWRDIQTTQYFLRIVLEN